jgi:hypothetical protein
METNPHLGLFLSNVEGVVAVALCGAGKIMKENIIPRVGGG